MAMASAKAAPRSMGTNSFSVDSGLRPIDSIALPTSRPMASAGSIPPTPIANAFANIFATSGSIDLRTIDRRGLFIVVYVLLKNEGCLPVRRGDTLWVSSVARNSNWVLFMTPVRLFGQDREIHEREHGEDGRLDDSNQDFEKHEWHGDDERYQTGDHGHKHLASEDIAEQAERQRQNLCELGHDFKESDQKFDHGHEDLHGIQRLHALPESAQLDESVPVNEEANREHPEHVGRDNREQRHGQGQIQVAHCRSQDGHELELAVDDLPHADGSRSRQEPHPVRQEDEDEQRSHERKKPFRLRPALRDLIEIPEHGLEQQLDKVLNPARDFVQRRTEPE